MANVDVQAEYDILVRKQVEVEAENLTLQAEMNDLQKAVAEWRAKADGELSINAGLHTETGQLQAENEQLLERANKAEAVLVKFEQLAADEISGFNALEAENKRLKEENRWIPVSERLPQEKGYISIADANLQIPQTWFWTNTNAQVDRLKIFCTHWKLIILPEQPLKEPPIQKTESENRK